MEEKATVSEIPMHVVDECLVVPIQVELRDDVALRIQREILRKVHQTAVRGVIIDVSGVNVIDSFLAQTISDTTKMASLLGAATVLVGLKPGVAAALVDLEAEFRDIRTVRTLQHGLDMLDSILHPEDEAEEVEQPEVEDIQDRETEKEDDED